MNLHKVPVLQNSVIKAVKVCLKSCSLLYTFCKVNKVMQDLTIDLSSLLSPQTPAFIHAVQQMLDSCCIHSLNNAGLPGFLRSWSSGIRKSSSVSVHPADCLRIVVFCLIIFVYELKSCFFCYAKARPLSSARGKRPLPTTFKNVDSALANTILNEVVDSGPSITFDDIGKYLYMISSSAFW